MMKICLSLHVLCIHFSRVLYCVSQKEVDTNVTANFIKIIHFLKLYVRTINKYSLDFQCDKYSYRCFKRFACGTTLTDLHKSIIAVNDCPFLFIGIGWVEIYLFFI